MGSKRVKILLASAWVIHSEKCVKNATKRFDNAFSHTL